MTIPAAVWQFAGSLLAVSVLILLAWRLGFTGRPSLTEAEARSWADGIAGGFEPDHIVLDRGGHGALLRDRAGRIAAVVPHGAHFVARLLAPTVTARVEDDALVLRLASLPLRLDIGAGAAADWAAAIDRLG